MNPNSNGAALITENGNSVSGGSVLPSNAEQRLKELGIVLPHPPEPFCTYVEAVRTGNLLFLIGMLPPEGHGAKFVGRFGAELDVEAGRKAAHLATVPLGAQVELEVIFEVAA